MYILSVIAFYPIGFLLPGFSFMHFTNKQVFFIASGCFSCGVALGCGILLTWKKNKQYFYDLFFANVSVWPYNVKYEDAIASKSIKIIVSEDDFEQILPSLNYDLTQVPVCEWSYNMGTGT